MAEDLSASMSDSFHSLSHSSSSFRIVDSAAELPSRRATSSVPITGGGNDWEQMGSSSTYSHGRSDSFGRGSHYDSPSRTNAYPSSGSTTARPMTPLRSKTPSQRDHLATPTAPTSKHVPASKAGPRILRTEVWKDLLLVSDGRDKAFVSPCSFRID